MLRRGFLVAWVVGGATLPLAVLAAAMADPGLRSFVSRADSPPRKVVVASVVAGFSGSLETRVEFARTLLARAAGRAGERSGGRRLDLMVLPEFAIEREGASAEERAVELEDATVQRLRESIRQHATWMIVPMTLRETGPVTRISNAAVLFDREGRVAGVFRKVHPMPGTDGRLEGGVTPGETYPVFECDFGRLGILICWDMAYEEAWENLAAGGAEIVALPSASPQTLRPMAQALRHRYFVLTSTPRDNASLFDPIGLTVAQETSVPGVLVAEIDLAYAILHWSEGLRDGAAVTERYGARAGFRYSAREDTGVFWSNDSQLTVRQILTELDLREMPEQIEAVAAARRR